MSQPNADPNNTQQRPQPTIVISMQSSANKKDKDEPNNTIKHATKSNPISSNRNRSLPNSHSSLSLKSYSSPRSGTKKKTERFFYRPIKVIGKGAFGVVYCSKGRNGELVAVKKVRLNPHYKNRELDILRELDHPNCIKLLDEFKTNESFTSSSILAVSRKKTGKDDDSSSQKNDLSIVMDYLPLTLHQFSLKYQKSQKQSPLIFTKLFSYQLFTGLHYIHEKLKITHRDIKPENILVDIETGLLKICDFGSAKELVPGEKSVSYIASRYYRAPELIMGCEFYTTAIDIWAAGCVIAEILTCGIPFFAAHESSKQIEEIAAIIGPPRGKDLQSFPHPPVNFKVEQSSSSPRSPQSLSKKHNRSSITLDTNPDMKLKIASSPSSSVSVKPTSTRISRQRPPLTISETTKSTQKAQEYPNVHISHHKNAAAHESPSMLLSSTPHSMKRKSEKVLVQRTTIEKALPSNTPPDLLDLLKEIFVYNPLKRPTAAQCMGHPFFADLFDEKAHLPNGNRLPPLEKPPPAPSPLVPQSQK